MRMNASVRPSRSRNFHFVIEQLFQRPLQLTLNRSELRLNLPAVKLRTVISKCQLEVPHPIGYSMRLGVQAIA